MNKILGIIFLSLILTGSAYSKVDWQKRNYRN
jgi:hypothetical protein